MRPFAFLFLFLLQAFLAAASPANVTSHRSCGTTLTADELRNVQDRLAIEVNTLPTNATRITSKLAEPIQVYWHVVRPLFFWHSSSLSNAQIATSIQALNSHWSGSGFTFVLQGTTRSTNWNWFYNAKRNTPAEMAMKKALRRGDRKTLNIYSIGMDRPLGYAEFPWDYHTNPWKDGVVILHSSRPGGSATNYNQGKTLTHEVGHWLGMFHVFQGESCSGPGDIINDTPIQRTPSYECAWGKDTCPGGGVDSIHNYMDYSYDWCMWQFTPGQLEWARWVAQAWRGIV